MWTAIASTALAIGPTLGGLLVQANGWRSIFLVNVPVGIVAVILTLRFVAESLDARERRFDVPGQFLFALGVGAFAYAVIEAPKTGWLSKEIVGLFAVAAGAFAAFVASNKTKMATIDGMLDALL